MAVFDLYSKRKKRALGGASDVFTYDEVPDALRTQIVHIWRDAIGVPSTMKVICTKRKWKFDPKAAAKDLVNVCLSNDLIPAYWQTHFNGLRSVLESAISTPRNRQAGHGAGAGPSPEIPEELVSYVLHMTAATVLFLAKADQAMGKS